MWETIFFFHSGNWLVRSQCVHSFVSLLLWILWNCVVLSTAVTDVSAAPWALQQISLHLQCCSDSRLDDGSAAARVSCITEDAEKPPPFLCSLSSPLRGLVWPEIQRTLHSYLQSAWALHALMMARGTACRTACFGDWHASFWTLNFHHESTDNW